MVAVRGWAGVTGGCGEIGAEIGAGDGEVGEIGVVEEARQKRGCVRRREERCFGGLGVRDGRDVTGVMNAEGGGVMTWLKGFEGFEDDESDGVVI